MSLSHGYSKNDQTPFLLEMDPSKELRQKSALGINGLKTGFQLLKSHGKDALFIYFFIHLFIYYFHHFYYYFVIFIITVIIITISIIIIM